jgi:hypothetical protein
VATMFCTVRSCVFMIRLHAETASA